MQENETRPPETTADFLEKPHDDDIQGSSYEFYLLLQRFKAGGISFDTFIERAADWAKLRAAHNRQR